ncbi:MAG: hypothetical protein FWB90_05745 [Fibromonadales bacterium]|nr:hypothetical protein [Fibromonadales bacterium]
MTIYMVLFFFGFMLAVGLLAYTSTQVTELNKKTDEFGKSLEERYSKPLSSLDELLKRPEEKIENENV